MFHSRPTLKTVRKNQLTVTMNFPFDAEKTAQAAAAFIQMDGGRIEVLKLVKLLYISERSALQKRSAPIYGGSYYSLPHGPIISESLNLINGDGLRDDQAVWDAEIGSRNENWLSRSDETRVPMSLSKAEMNILKEVHSEHGEKSAWGLREWTHENLPEYEDVSRGRIRITLKEIGLAVDVCPNEIASEASAQRIIHDVFSS